MSEALKSPSPSTPPKKSLTEIFNKFAADAVERFPHLKGQIMVVNMNQMKAYGNKDIDTKKTGLTPETALEYVSNHPITQELKDDKGASSCATFDPKQKVNLIFINDGVPKEQFDNVSKETEQHLLFVLDHELAHCGIKDGFSRASSSRDYKILLSESVADAYAMIRHYQRYGAESDPRNKYIGSGARANHFVLGGDNVHFTSFVLDAIVKRKGDIDFDKLTPEQTADLARRFAMKYMPPERALEDLGWTFSAIRSEFRKDPNGGMKALIEKALDPASDYYTFKMASLWLKPMLEDRTFMDGKPIGLPKEYLDDAAAKMKVRDAKFEKEDILFNMPIKTKKAAPPSKIAA